MWSRRMALGSRPRELSSSTPMASRGAPPSSAFLSAVLLSTRQGRSQLARLDLLPVLGPPPPTPPGIPLIQAWYTRERLTRAPTYQRRALGETTERGKGEGEGVPQRAKRQGSRQRSGQDRQADGGCQCRTRAQGLVVQDSRRWRAAARRASNNGEDGHLKLVGGADVEGSQGVAQALAVPVALRLGRLLLRWHRLLLAAPASQSAGTTRLCSGCCARKASLQPAVHAKGQERGAARAGVPRACKRRRG
jgi:hypothetical protein